MSESKEEVPESPTSGDVPQKDLDQVLSDIGFGIYQVQLIAILCVGNMADAMEVTLLSYLSPCAEVEFDLSSFQTSFLTGIVFVGEMTGAFVFGKLADHKGRRYAYVIALIFIVTFGVLTFFTTNYWELVVCRGLAGLGLGAGLVPFDYVSEAVPANIRGIACMMNGVCWGLGSLLVAGMAWLVLDDYGWRLLALLCTIPSIIALMTVFTITESPRWLLMQERNEEAVQALKTAAKRNGKDIGEFSLTSYPHPGRPEGQISEIFKGSLLKPTLLLSALWLVHGFSYYAIILAISNIFQTSDSCSFDYSDIFVSTLSEPIFTLLAATYIDISRRWANAGNYLAASICTVCLGLPLTNYPLEALAFFARGTIRAASAATWTITPELYPTEIRTSAHAVFYVISRIGAYGEAYLSYAPLSEITICLLIGGITLLGVFISLAFEETAGTGMDDIQQQTPNRPKERKRHKAPFDSLFKKKKKDDKQDSLLASGV